ncbi:MAG: hypothetical protein ABIP03_06720 [Aquihabitans sp.]
MTSPDLHQDDNLLAQLAVALEVADPIPAAAIHAAVAAFDLGHLEGELAVLLADSAADSPLVGLRHEGTYDRYVEMEASGMTIEIDLPADQPILIGQLDPAGPAQVIVEFAPPGERVERVTLSVDDLGRFQGSLQPGSLRLHLVAPSGPVTTPWIVR